ncbi:glycine/sarcosine N-methyltransferase [Dethiosulfatarculus sandiegensis]|uniref:SAM-dependent methyltransferase n=1 Tax=Dethiosulfatarculus sandiegensis TaxID=1429043 RepID=A0A0D2J566_9BACT|nr:class I SAM-dependent methyltransferase [Dethiosulfatarculus sandiegensis]KIX10851.1 SAM-dependent methyltransferase [Dethiosulfatarculus sandiegensis]
MSFAKTQDFGLEPVEVRESDHYQEEYVTTLADKWDELIDWKRRAKAEGDFFIRTLKEHGAKKILDVATGTGFHSVRLLSEGFDVTSIDGSPQMLSKAFENAKRHGFILNTCLADWRFLNRDVHGEFDAIICLGNSFTHLFKENDRRKALAEYYSMLAHDGILVIDQRNYDGMLDDGFTSKHKYYYCGKGVVAEPEHVDEGLARFVYRFEDGSKFHLNMYPLRKKYMKGLLSDVGFQRVTTYSDFKQSNLEKDPDFFVHVAEKEYLEEKSD